MYRTYRIAGLAIILAAALWGAAGIAYGSAGNPAGLAPPTGATTTANDYDSDDDGLIEVNSLARLNAIRWDLDGNGGVDTGVTPADTASYNAAFPNPAAGMGCQLVDHDDDAVTAKTPVCTGYELTQNLDFDTDDDGATYTVSATDVVTGDAGDTYYNGGKGWTPMGTHTAPFTATFDGKGYTIANLFIHRTATDTGKVGLFGQISASGIVRELGLTDVNITGPAGAGSLAGSSNGAVTNCYATGSVASLGAVAVAPIGGLVGLVNGGTITSSYAAVAVSGRTSAGTGRDLIGGLVGKMLGSTAVITASYATGAVSSGATDAKVGGLVGNIYKGASIISSYATGAVSGSGSGNMVGGLVGWSGIAGGSVTASYATGTVTVSNSGYAGSLYGLAFLIDITDSYATGAVNAAAVVSIFGLLGRPDRQPTNSYWDTGATGQPSGDTRPNGVTNPHGANDPRGGQGKTTRELQAPTSNTGIYASWQAAQWDFGTSRQYPAVKHNGRLVPGQRQTSIQMDWNNPVVGEPVVAGLHITGGSSYSWQWQSSSDGTTWTNIANATWPSYVPVAADAANGGKYLRVQASYYSGGGTPADRRTLVSANTARVVATMTATEVAGATAFVPEVSVGSRLQYALSGAGATAPAWRWQMCDNQAMTAHCYYEPAGTAAYTIPPTAIGRYLRAYVYYAEGGVWKRATTPVLGPVTLSAAAP